MATFSMFKPNIKRMEAEKDVKGLKKALNKKDEYVRAEAAEALGKIGDERAVEILIQALRDVSNWVRGHAAKALGSIGDPTGVVPLLRALKNEKEDSFAYGEEVRALGEMGDIKALELLTQTLNEESAYRIKIAIIKALRKMGKPAAGALNQALKDRSSGVRKAAVRALGEMGDIGALESFKETLAVGSEYEKKIAVKYFRKIGEPAAQALVKAIQDDCSMVREEAAEALLDMRAWKVLPQLGELLWHDNGFVNEPVLKVLNNTGWKPQNTKQEVEYLIACESREKLLELGKEAVATLINIFKNDNIHISYRLAAVQLLGEIGDKRALQPIRQIKKAIERRREDPAWNKGYYAPIDDKDIGYYSFTEVFDRVINKIEGSKDRQE